MTAAALAVTGVVWPVEQPAAKADVQLATSQAKGADGKEYTVTNHLVPDLVRKSREGGAPRKKWLLVWAGDENIADTLVDDIKGLPGSLAPVVDKVRNALPGPDFMAVIDATQGSPTYGKVVNTATVGPLVENEPHHMQYVWHKGDKIYAGGLFGATTYVFDVKKLPELKITGVSLPTQTPCGSVPDAYWVLKDGTAYGTYMGGPVVPGPCRYTHGEVRSGNGFAGTPGEVVRFDEKARVLSESPAAIDKPEDPKACLNMPALSAPTCANPHGIQVREDLNTMVTSDYAEPRTIILDPVQAPSPYLRRPTVRTWDISDRNHPKIKNVSTLPEGPRSGDENPLYNENMAVMETTVTNRPGHKGAFAQTMTGGAIYYTPDITAEKPVWREVFDLSAVTKKLDPKAGDGRAARGGWLQTSPDDRYLYHAMMGRNPGTLGENDPGTPGGVFRLDISKLVAAGTNFQCDINTPDQIEAGGTAPDCPTLAGGLKIDDETSGGPHWGALDNFELGKDGYYHETQNPKRLSTANYFVARTGLGGNHKVCIADVDDKGITLDSEFKDENNGAPCVDFNRKSWPHGDFGNAKPHSQLFVIADEDVK